MPIRVLIVDDCIETLEILEVIYRMIPGVSMVETATSHIETLKKLESITPDIISIDIHLGLDDGFILCEEIKLKYPNSFITICSFANTTENIRRAKECGALYFLAKPVMYEDVLMMLDCYYDKTSTIRSGGDTTDVSHSASKVS